METGYNNSLKVPVLDESNGGTTRVDSRQSAAAIPQISPDSASALPFSAGNFASFSVDPVGQPRPFMPAGTGMYSSDPEGHLSHRQISAEMPHVIATTPTNLHYLNQVESNRTYNIHYHLPSIALQPECFAQPQDPGIHSQRLIEELQKEIKLQTDVISGLGGG